MAQTQFPSHQSLLVVFLAISCLLIIGCGRPSYEDREAQFKSKIEEARHKKEEAESELLEQISAKFNLVSFPNKDISKQAFSYELDQFFKKHMEHAILFKSYIEDIEETDDGILVEFTCPLNSDLLDDTPIVSFHLKASLDQVKGLLNKPQRSSSYGSLRYFNDPDYFVVAKVHNIARARRYEFRGSAFPEGEIELSVETPPRFVALGDLIEAISPPR